MRVLVAPNAFKGSLGVVEAARALGDGVREALPEAEVLLLPLSDGGDGLIDCLLFAREGRRVSVAVRGPLGERRRAEFAMLAGGTAVVEMAKASGLALVPLAKRDPLGSTSYGTGQLIDAALKSGARTILVGMGGSATNDGGAGMAQALGCRLLDAGGRELKPGAEALLRLERVEAGGLRSRLKGARVIAVSDVTNPLAGPRGSARIFGPQKGASPAQVRLLEKALERYARVLQRDLGVAIARRPGAGAAGGLGAGLAAFLGAELVAGSEFVLRELGAEKLLRQSDALLTGEGKLDATSFYGKAPIEMARRAQDHGVPAAAVCGLLDETVRRRLRSAGIASVATLAEAGAAPSNSMTRAARWIPRAAALAIKRLLLACAFMGVAAAARSAPASPTASVDEHYFQRDQGGRLEESLSQLERLLASSPGDAQLLWRNGRALVRLGERGKTKKDKLASYERAEQALRQAVAADPGNAEAHFWLGIAMGRRGQVRGMLRSLFLVGPIRREMETTLRLDPGHGGAHHVLGEILLRLPGFAGGSKKEAVRELEEAVRLHPNYAVNLTSLGEAYIAVGEKTKAEAVLRKVFEIAQPGDPAEYPDNVKEAEALLEKLKKS